MRDILSRTGRAALSSLARGQVLFAFDFDGTLAPLKRHPRDVRIPDAVLRALHTLAAVAPVAVVSGRSLLDLRKFFPRFSGSLIGNHGAEGLPEGRAALRSARRSCDRWRPHLRRLLRSCRPCGNAWLEDKTYSFTLHSRSPAALRAFRTLLSREASALPPLRLLPGKASVNLLPASLLHKGDAVALLLRRVHARKGLFVGDDETDEDVFRSGPRTLVTVRVGSRVDSQAAFRLRSQRDIVRLLRFLIDLRRVS